MRLLPFKTEFDSTVGEFTPSTTEQKANRLEIAGAGVFSFFPRRFRYLLGPGVYMAWKGKQALYIGSAKNLLARMSEESHGSFKKALDEADWIEVIVGLTEMQAREIELLLIAAHQPTYNVVGKNKTGRNYVNSRVEDDEPVSINLRVVQNGS